MIEQPIFALCRRCVFLSKCNAPFPASGKCPHPDQAQRGEEHPLLHQPMGSHRYAFLLAQDAQATSLFHRWRRGLVPTNADFEHLRGLLYEGLGPRAEGVLVADAVSALLKDILLDALTLLAHDIASYYFVHNPGVPDVLPKDLSLKSRESAPEPSPHQVSRSSSPRSDVFP